MSTRAILLAVFLAACGTEAKPAPSASEAPPPPPSGSSAMSAPTASASAVAPPTDKLGRVTAAIRRNASDGEMKDGGALASRLFVSTLAPTDPLSVALALRPEKAMEKDHPWRKELVQLEDIVPSLTFEIDTPSGRRALETERVDLKGSLSLAQLRLKLEVRADGVHYAGKLHPWKTAEKGLFDAAGSYSLAIRGHIKASQRSLPVATGPLSFEVASAGARRPLTELEAKAAALVKEKKELAAAPRRVGEVVEDDDGNVSFRFQLARDGRGKTEYHVEIVEVLLGPTGDEENFDAFRHFTCVAEGTLIATPAGGSPVESLAPGDTVLAYDVSAERITTAVVEHIERSHAERLVDVGGVLVTPSHVFYADGAWRPAGEMGGGSTALSERLAWTHVTPRRVDQPGAVYQLGVSPPHTYFAGGLLSHNKAAHNPVGKSEPRWGEWFWRRSAKGSR